MNVKGQINMLIVINNDFGGKMAMMIMMKEPVHLVPLADHTWTGFSLACEAFSSKTTN